MLNCNKCSHFSYKLCVMYVFESVKEFNLLLDVGFLCNSNNLPPKVFSSHVKDLYLLNIFMCVYVLNLILLMRPRFP